jgi:hypothetical protein
MGTPPPNAAQQAQQAADRRATNREMAGLQARLREAGVQFDARKWHDFSPFWDPTGFEFMCDDVKALQRAAENSSKMGIHSIDMPSGQADPWVSAGIVSVGFSEVNKPKYLHLDIAINRPGLCRLYATERMWALKRDTNGMAKLVMARDNPVYQKIARRLAALNPSINIDEHIGAKIVVGHSTLDGITFEAKDHKRLEDALRACKDASGGPAFAVGSKDDPSHWALRISFKATKGIGFREIWRPYLSDRPLSMDDVLPGRERFSKNRFSANFGDRLDLPDLTSLHCAVSPYECNVHIDEMGFVMTDANGSVIVNPNAPRHTAVELLWKTNLKGKVPQWVLDRFSFDIFSTPNDFSRVGVSFDLVQSEKYKLTLRGGCGVHGGFNCSGTLTFSAKHDVGSGRR